MDPAYLGLNAGFDKTEGSLILGGHDTALTAPTSSISIPFGQDISRDLLVGVQQITSNATSQALLPNNLYAFVDSTVPYIYLPQESCIAFETAFSLTYNAQSDLYLVNDTLHQSLLAQNPSITFTVGAQPTGGQTVNITLPYAAFDLKATYPLLPVNTSSLYFPLKRTANETQYTLGRTFFQEAVVTADYERRNFTLGQRIWQPNQQPQIRIIESPGDVSQQNVQDKRSSLSGSVIGGIVAAAVVALLVAAGILVFAICRHRRRKAGKAVTTVKKQGHLGVPYGYLEADSTSRSELSWAEALGAPGMKTQGRSELAAPVPVPHRGEPDAHLSPSSALLRAFGGQPEQATQPRSELAGSGVAARGASATPFSVYEMPGDEGPPRLRHSPGGRV